MNVRDIRSILRDFPRDLNAEDLHGKLKGKSVDQNQLNELGHAYYCAYYKKPFAPLARPTSSKLADLHGASSASSDIPELSMAAPVSAPAPAACNVDAGANYVLSPHDFAVAFRAIHPSELVNAYYHDANVCGETLESFLHDMTGRLHQYFDGNLGPLRQLLQNITKCICLRIVLRSAYNYAHYDAGKLTDEAAQLLHFYQLTSLIHPQDDQHYHSHLVIIKTYNNLKKLVTTLLEVGKLSVHQLLLDRIGLSFNKIFTERGERTFCVSLEFSYNDSLHISDLIPFTRWISNIGLNIKRDLDMVHTIQNGTRVMNSHEIFAMGIKFGNSIHENLKRGADVVFVQQNYDNIHRIGKLVNDAYNSLAKPHDLEDDEILTFRQFLDHVENLHPRVTAEAHRRREAEHLQAQWLERCFKEAEEEAEGDASSHHGGTRTKKTQSKSRKSRKARKARKAMKSRKARKARKSSKR